MQAAVVGAGSWGTAVAWLLSSKGLTVTMWARRPEIARCINEEHRNPVYLKDVRLPEPVHATADIAEAIHGAEAVVIVTPSQGVRGVAEGMKGILGRETPVVNLAKGIEMGTLLRMTQVLGEVLGNRGRLAALSGPNHAEEVSKGVPSAAAIAAYDASVGRFLQDMFMSPSFRVYTNPDVVGVELGGASKNVIAVAAGMSDGLGFGDNTKATLMTRGLAEMSRLGVRLGANPLTYMGLAGMGDLIVTCTSRHSRNRALGEWLARGGTVESYTATTNMVAEGATSAIALHELAKRNCVDLPITALVRAILYDGHPVTEAVEVLMGRAAEDEFHGLELLENGE